jgi:hypothetical protein
VKTFALILALIAVGCGAGAQRRFDTAATRIHAAAKVAREMNLVLAEFYPCSRRECTAIELARWGYVAKALGTALETTAAAELALEAAEHPESTGIFMACSFASIGAVVRAIDEAGIDIPDDIMMKWAAAARAMEAVCAFQPAPGASVSSGGSEGA